MLGVLYSALQIDSESRALVFRAAEKVFIRPNTALKVSAFFEPADKPNKGGAKENGGARAAPQQGLAPRLRVQVAHKKFFGDDETLRATVRARFDVSKRFLKASAHLKKRVPLAQSTSLNFRGDCTTKIHAKQLDNLAVETPELSARTELSHKMFAGTSTQDFQIRLGYDFGDREAYISARENRLSMQVGSSGKWHVLYDI